MAGNTRSPEQKDLDFIDVVDFRIADYSNNEKKLQEYLKTNLVPLIDKAKNVLVVQRKVSVPRPGRRIALNS
jgi:proteasome component ECM29